MKSGPPCASVPKILGSPGLNLLPRLTSIFLRPLPPALLNIVNRIKLPVPFSDGHPQPTTRAILDSDSGPRCSPVTVTTLTLRLPVAGTTQLSSNNPTVSGNLLDSESDLKAPQFAEITNAHPPKPIVGHATFEIGPLSSSFARYVKFSVDAPVNALTYAVFIAGHCLPDPPGSLYPVHLTPLVFDVKDFSRTFCLNLHSNVRCRSSGSFVFSLRITLYFLYVGNEPQSVQFRPRGAFENFSDALCLGETLTHISLCL